MKLIFLIGLVVLGSKVVSTGDGINRDAPNGRNVFIITLDGYRWHELFNGADSALINNAQFTAVPSSTKAKYWHTEAKVRREKLMPFVWNVISKEGQIFGNRKLGSKVNTTNFYSVSYPGYNEIFTGDTDPFIYGNKKIKNKNKNLLEHLNKIPQYKGKIAAFTSWDVFPYILAEERSNIYVNAGYEPLRDRSLSGIQNALSINQASEVSSERKDLHTFSSAKAYIKKKHPKIMFIGLGGTDSYAHQKNYAQYLKEANQADKIISDLWHLTQADPFYKNNTTFIITTDHGRGGKTDTWYKHGAFISGSSQTWMMMFGEGIKPLGENVGKGQLHQKHIAGTVGYLVGIKSFNKLMLPAAYFIEKNAAGNTAFR